jgi:hypothetical protein
MFCLIHSLASILRVSTPQQEHDSFLVFVNGTNDGLSECGPSRLAVARRRMRSHSQTSIQKEDTLGTPLRQMSMLGTMESRNTQITPELLQTHKQETEAYPWHRHAKWRSAKMHSLMVTRVHPTLCSPYICSAVNWGQVLLQVRRRKGPPLAHHCGMDPGR